MSEEQQKPQGRKITRVRDTLAAQKEARTAKRQKGWTGSDGFGEFFNPAPPCSAPKPAPISRILTFVVTNKSSKTKTVRLFDADWFKKNEKGKDVSIVLSQASYSTFLTNTLIQPMFLKGMKMQAKGTEQMSQSLRIEQESPLGGCTSMSYEPLHFLSAYAYCNNRIEDDSFELPVDSFTHIEFEILPDEMVSFTFYVHSMHSRMQAQPHITGLPNPFGI